MEKKLVRVTGSELEQVIKDSVSKLLMKESTSSIRELQLAQKELYSISDKLSGIGMRLEGTAYSGQFRKLWTLAKDLNNALIEEIRNSKRQ